MADFNKLQENLKKRGYKVAYFETSAEAAQYLNDKIDNTSVGFGGSKTSKALGLYESLGAHNQVAWHWEGNTLEEAMTTEVYISSMNGVSEDGQLINIDGNGNRVASTVWDHSRQFFLIGRNKIAPTYDEALWRARNIASPIRTKELGGKTPCSVNADKCYDCKSPGRACRTLMVMWGPMMNTPETEVILINEDLGY